LAVELMTQEPDVNREALIYLNRLSDLLFVLARVANSNGESDVLWQPGQNTKSSKDGS
jgi:cob(I)alamin adenosyltransferase